MMAQSQPAAAVGCCVSPSLLVPSPALLSSSSSASSPAFSSSEPSTSSIGSEKTNNCQRCQNHGLHFSRKNHKRYCRFVSCTCAKCELVEQRRQTNNAIARLIKPVGPTYDENGRKIRRPICANCAAHGDTEQRTKGHSARQCPFRDCTCEACSLLRSRRRIMSTQVRARRQQAKALAAGGGSAQSLSTVVDSTEEEDTASSHASTESVQATPPPPQELLQPLRPVPLRPITVALPPPPAPLPQHPSAFFVPFPSSFMLPASPTLPLALPPTPEMLQLLKQLFDAQQKINVHN